MPVCDAAERQLIHSGRKVASTYTQDGKWSAYTLRVEIGHHIHSGWKVASTPYPYSSYIRINMVAIRTLYPNKKLANLANGVTRRHTSRLGCLRPSNAHPGSFISLSL